MSRLLLFVAVPLTDMALLIWSAARIGLPGTVAIVLLTGIAGAFVVKRQGMAVWAAARHRLSEGGIPSLELAHGAMLLVAGAFLMTPGFITDLAGLMLLVPPFREWLRQRISRRYRNRVRVEVWR